ncbi:MAG: Fic family protein [Candidatus Pacebacteria bacterium]|nr:Fic family protein [Candidatus Paceibacterota bacterium]
MNQPKLVQIWNPKTGILPLSPEEAAAIAPRETQSIIDGIAAETRRLEGSQALVDFNGRLRREWSVMTNLIEGVFTLDRGTTTTLIEWGFDPRYIGHGASDRSANDVYDALIDCEEVLNGLYDFIKGDRVFGTSYIKELHSQLTRSQETSDAVDSFGVGTKIPLLRGAWKTHPNSPLKDGTIYQYCSPENTASEMDQLIAGYDALVAANSDPIVVAAWLHHRFTQIHPFQDGNGRVVRALVTLVLIRAGLTPFTVTSEQRADYLDALEAADSDSSAVGLVPLVEMIKARCLNDYSTIMKVAEESRAQSDKSEVNLTSLSAFNNVTDQLFAVSRTVAETVLVQTNRSNSKIINPVVESSIADLLNPYEAEKKRNNAIKEIHNNAGYAFLINRTLIQDDKLSRSANLIFPNYHPLSINIFKNEFKYSVQLTCHSLIDFKEEISFLEAEKIDSVLERYKIWFQTNYSRFIVESHKNR